MSFQPPIYKVKNENVAGKLWAPTIQTNDTSFKYKIIKSALSKLKTAFKIYVAN